MMLDPPPKVIHVSQLLTMFGAAFLAAFGAGLGWHAATALAHLVLP